MGKIIALDIGGRRTGIAETDELQLIASPKETIDTSILDDYIKNLLEVENVECLVVGNPLNLSGGDSDNSSRVRHYVSLFQKQYPNLKIELEDERFTSKLASKALLAGGMKKKKRQDKTQLDKVSAAIILQSYLDRK